MDYISPKDAANKWGVSERMVCKYLQQGRIGGLRMNNSTLLYAAVFILLSTAVFFFLRLDYVLLDMITHRAERKAKIRSFKKQSKLSKAIDKLLAKCASLIANSQMPRSAYYALTVICAIGGFFAGKVIFSSFPIALAVSTFGLIAPLALPGAKGASTCHMSSASIPQSPSSVYDCS